MMVHQVNGFISAERSSLNDPNEFSVKVQCDECRKFFSESNAKSFNGEIRCPKCYKEAIVEIECDRCGKTVRFGRSYAGRGDKNYCQSCMNDMINAADRSADR